MDILRMKKIPCEIQKHILSFHPLFISKVFRSYRKIIFINGIYNNTLGINKKMYINELKRPCVFSELEFAIVDSNFYRRKTIIFIYTANILLHTNDMDLHI